MHPWKVEFAPGARRFRGKAAEQRHRSCRGARGQIVRAQQRTTIAQGLRHRVADGTARHLRAQSPQHFDDARRNLQATSRFGHALVVRQDGPLPLVRHGGEHTSQAVNLARGHSLDRIDQDEAERRFRLQYPRQKQAERKRVDRSLCAGRRSHDGAGVA